jgi:hypothetical protein
MADPKPRGELAKIKREIEEASGRVIGLAEDGPGDLSRHAMAAGAFAGVALKALSAVEAALKHHERVPLYGNASTEAEPGNCPHDPDDENWHFEPAAGPGEWLCEGKPEGAVCSTCIDGEGGERTEWPCPEYEGILAALTGKDKADD